MTKRRRSRWQKQVYQRHGHKHDGAIFSIDYYAYASAIRGWNPYFKTVFSLIILILCIAYDNFYVSLAIVTAMAYITVCLGRLSLRRYASLLAIPIAFMLLGGTAIALGVSKNPIGQYRLHLGFFYVYASKESMLRMLRLLFKSFGAVSAIYMLTLSTPASEIIVALRSARVPKIMIELMNMIYRYIFILMDAQIRMKNAAASRLGYCDYRTSLVSFGKIASNLFIVSIKKGIAYYQALESRGYDGELIFLTEDKPIKARQVMGAVLLVVFLTMLWLVTR